MNNATTHPFLRKAAVLIAALVVAALAFGIGLPWIIVDAPPQAETLWAREVQSRAPEMALPPLSFAKRVSVPNAVR